MANQITIDIVAETNKLTSGINDANKQIDGMSGKLKGIASVAAGAAAGFLAKQGYTFLKQGADEAEDARIAMNNAESAFGKGSATLQKITQDAEKFGKALAVDNDDIIKLSTSLGSRLPADAQGLSAELVNLSYDIQAVTNGAITAESFSSKLAKAFSDGEISSKELQKIFPKLSESTLAQAEALSKAGKNQEALTLLINEGQQKYGDAAEKNVTSSQKFETALNDLKEQIGGPVLTVVNKLIDGLLIIFDAFDKLPGPVKNIIIALGLLLTTGALTLTFLASMKTSMVTLGIVNGTTAGTTTAAATATNLLSTAMKALPILAVIALIVLLVQNWDTVKEVVDKVWIAIKNFAANAKEAIGEFGAKVKGFVDGIIDKFETIPGAMLSVGKNIVTGLWNGIQGMASWLKDKVTGFFKNLLPSWAEKALGISSPSKVFAGIGTNIINGLQSTFNAPAVKSVSNRAQAGISVPTASLPSLMSGTARSGINITINAGLGTNGPALGRQVSSAIKQYGKVSTKASF